MNIQQSLSAVVSRPDHNCPHCCPTPAHSLIHWVGQVYMEARDHAGLIAAVARYGDESRGGDPQLWAEVLQYFVSLPPNDECEAQVGRASAEGSAA
jgi:hypothetical protein